VKLQLVSDLHVESNPLAPFETRGDVLVIAGDTHVEPAGLAQWLQHQQPEVPAIIVLGNHEFDHKRFDEVLPAFRAAVADFPNVHLLERDRVDIGGVTFLGANLWTDMRGGLDAPAVARVLKWFDMRGVTVDDLMAVHRATREWLRAELRRAGERAVVVTHTAPSYRSQHPRFAGSPLNGFFASDMDRFVEELRPQLWLHGHMHDAVDYRIGATRVVSNPRGYAGENPRWDPAAAIIEVA
jgi:Icc-related predicted phosphoesterase